MTGFVELDVYTPKKKKTEQSVISRIQNYVYTLGASSIWAWTFITSRTRDMVNMLKLFALLKLT